MSKDKRQCNKPQCTVKGIVIKEGKTTKGMLRTATPSVVDLSLGVQANQTPIRGDLACAMPSYSEEPIESLQL